MISTLEFSSRAKRFMDLWPERTALVEGVPFRRKEGSNKIMAQRQVLVISTANLDRTSKKKIKEDFLHFTEEGLVSFPAWEKATHLFLRLGRRVFDNGFYVLPGIFRFGDIPLSLYRFRESDYPLPKTRRLETLVRLSPEELSRLSIYVRNIQKNRKKTLGKYDHGGSQKTRALLDDNRTLEKGHNCTTWLSTAPIGPKGEAFLEVMGSNRDVRIGDNTGWWLTFLQSQGPEERIPMIVYWTSSTLEMALDKEVKSGQPIAWDYLRR